MNGFTAMVLQNALIIGLIAFGVWYTASPWPLLGLLFLVTYSERNGE